MSIGSAFRRLRTNKGQGYLIYAVGEVMLVMVGILLALQVNNWNSERERRVLEEKLLLQVYDELGSLMNDLSGDIEVINAGVRAHYYIMETIEYDLPYTDSMCYEFQWIARDEYVYPIVTGYELIKASGTDLIRNEEIRKLLQVCYEVILPRISKIQSFYPDIEEFFTPYYQEHFKPNMDTSLVHELRADSTVVIRYPYKMNFDGKERWMIGGFIPNDFEALKNDTQFQMLMRQSIRFRLYKLSRYRSAEDIILKLADLISKEIHVDSIENQ